MGLCSLGPVPDVGALGKRRMVGEGHQWAMVRTLGSQLISAGCKAGESSSFSAVIVVVVAFSSLAWPSEKDS